MAKQNNREVKEFAVGMMEEEIPYMKSRRRKEAMRKYRRLLSAMADEPIYLTRS